MAQGDAVAAHLWSLSTLNVDLLLKKLNVDDEGAVYIQMVENHVLFRTLIY